MDGNEEKFVEFKTSDNLFLPGVLFEPEEKTQTAAIFLHGNGSSSVFYSMDSIRAMADKLSTKEIAYFAFNNRGSGYISKLKRLKNGKIEKVLAGTAYELIKDCVKDIDGAIKFLEQFGYREFYLIGFSTGANKICVYNYFKPNNKVSKYILVCGGDDSGTIVEAMGEQKFLESLKRAQLEIKNGNGAGLVPKEIINELFSWRSFYDIANPDGDYNTFPFYDSLNNLKLAKKKLFREFESIHKPSLVIYGDKDEYCYGRVPEVVELLKRNSSTPKKFTFSIVKNADHAFTDKQGELQDIISSWLDKG